MTLTPTEITFAYQLILERTPSDKEITNAASQHENLASLRQAFLNSEEFNRNYTRMQDRINSQSRPALVHLHIPKTAGTSLARVLAAEESLQPSRIVNNNSLEELSALPRSERRKLRYIRGHLSMGAGEALGTPYRYLCALRRPGPRIFSFYQFIRRSETHPGHKLLTEKDMSFGDFLEFSIESVNYRLEIDNGQLRRLAGQFNAQSLGHEPQLLRAALHNALAPNMILGLVERIDALIAALVAEGYLSSDEVARVNVSPNSDLYDEAIAALTNEQKSVFESYIAWDSYLYDVCEGLLFPPTAHGSNG